MCRNKIRISFYENIHDQHFSSIFGTQLVCYVRESLEVVAKVGKRCIIFFVFLSKNFYDINSLLKTNSGREKCIFFHKSCWRELLLFFCCCVHILIFPVMDTTLRYKYYTTLFTNNINHTNNDIWYFIQYSQFRILNWEHCMNNSKIIDLNDQCN